MMITPILTPKERAEAYAMWIDRHTFAQIARRFGVQQGKIIHIVMQEHRRQIGKCQRCRWRKDGQAVCLLPRCMKDVEKEEK